MNVLPYGANKGIAAEMEIEVVQHGKILQFVVSMTT